MEICFVIVHGFQLLFLSTSCVLHTFYCSQIDRVVVELIFCLFACFDTVGVCLVWSWVQKYALQVLKVKFAGLFVDLPLQSILIPKIILYNFP